MKNGMRFVVGALLLCVPLFVLAATASLNQAWYVTQYPSGAAYAGPLASYAQASTVLGAPWAVCGAGAHFAFYNSSVALCAGASLHIDLVSASCAGADILSGNALTCSAGVGLGAGSELESFPIQALMLLLAAMLMFGFGWLAGK